MGIKGRKKREREREEKRQRDIDAGLIDPDDDDDAPFAVFGDGPFQPPAGAKAPQLSNSELYRQRDEEVLEGMRDAHAKRRQSHLPTRKRARAEEEDEAEADTFLQPVDLTAEALIEATKERQRTEAVSLASGARFSHILLGIQPLLVTALSNEGFSRMTCIQERVIPLAIEGFDILGQAKTGSGKTLAFCIPVLQTTLAVHSKHAKSCLAVMMAPTKELCVQTHQILKGVCQHLTSTAKISVQLITGGTNVQEERRLLLDGANIVVGTPGRLHDHAKHCKGWSLQATRWLVLDEADRMLDIGFKKDLDSILHILPKSRQTLLFSATNSKSVKELARLCLFKTPLFISTKGEQPTFLLESKESEPPSYRILYDQEEEDGEDEEGGSSEQRPPQQSKQDVEDIPTNLTQFCHITPLEDRLRALYVFVKRVARKSKAMIFCSTVASTIFHCQMLGSIGFHNEVLMLHGQMKHRQRLATFQAFNEWPTGVLFCTDVAARGLDIPNVEWILQYDPPLDPTEYVHRIGRTARGGNVGNSLLFLTPQEASFVKYLHQFGIQMSKYPMPVELPLIQEKLEHALQLDPVVAKSATLAFRAHIGAYQSHVLQETFNVQDLDVDALAKAFALSSTPSVTLPKTATDSKKQEYIKGKLKSLNRRKAEAVKHYQIHKTKKQWADDGTFVGMSKPIRKL